MANSPRANHNRSLASEIGRYITPPAHLLGKMRAFNFAEHHGIKPSHVRIISDFCAGKDIILLVRETNEKSIQWIDKQGYIPKPVECKVKTANENGCINGQSVRCAGLVISPDVLGYGLYDEGREEAARKVWEDFKRKKFLKTTVSGVTVYLCNDTKGFYAVDIDQNSRHYGCLMKSAQDVPERFDPRRPYTRRWMNMHMKYIYGDYDLYGIIDVGKTQSLVPGKVHHVESRKENLHGEDHFVTERTKEIVDDLNRHLGLQHGKMIQHGEQSAWEHSGSSVYIFYPLPMQVQVVKESQFEGSSSEMEKYLEDLYRYIYKTVVVNPGNT